MSFFNYFLKMSSFVTQVSKFGIHRTSFYLTKINLGVSGVILRDNKSNKYVVLKLPWGPFKKYVRSEGGGGRGVSQKRTKSYKGKGGGGVLDESTYVLKKLKKVIYHF